MNTNNAKVQWLDVCLPKVEGGLGLKQVSQWNKAVIMKLIWLLLVDAGLLAIAWVKAYVSK